MGHRGLYLDVFDHGHRGACYDVLCICVLCVLLLLGGSVEHHSQREKGSGLCPSIIGEKGVDVVLPIKGDLPMRGFHRELACGLSKGISRCEATKGIWPIRGPLLTY